MAPFRQLTLYSGSDDFRRGAAVKAALDAVLPPEARDFDLTRLSGRTADGERLATALGTPPLFAERRVVLVDDAEQLSSAALAAFVAALDRLGKRAGETLAVLVVVGGDKKPDKQLAQRAGKHHEFGALKRHEAAQWVREYARTRHGLALDAGVAAALVARTGAEEAGPLAQELDKLASLADGAPITVALLEEATAATGAPSLYDFYDAVGQRRFAVAAEGLAALLALPEYPGVRLVIGLGLHLTAVAIARARLDAGEPLAAVAKALGGWMGGKYAEQAGAWSLSALDAALAGLLDVDVALKSGAHDARTLLAWLTRTCHPGLAPGAAAPAPSTLPDAALAALGLDPVLAAALAPARRPASPPPAS